MISNHNLGALMGAPVQGEDDKIGTVGQIFVDPESGNPNWVTVHTGLFGRRETFVPLDDATWDHEVLHVPFDKKTIKDAPRIDTDEALSPEHEADLYRYYRLGGQPDSDIRRDERDAVVTDTRTETDAVVGDSAVTDARADTGADSGTGQGPLRLRKYVVTEDKEVTVPVQHEEVRVETEGDVQVDTSDVPDLQVTQGQGTQEQDMQQPVSGEQRTGRHAKEE
jgi:hypothetical protein